MAKKTAAPKYRGGRKNLRGEMQKESQDGRQGQNRGAKQSFKRGPIANSESGLGEKNPA